MCRITHLAAQVLLAASLMPALGGEVPHPPLEAYGSVPGVRLMQISPDGRTLAFIGRSASGSPLLFVYDIEKGMRGGVDLLGGKPRGVRFVGNDYVIVVVSDTTGRGERFRIEISGAYSYSLHTNTVRELRGAVRMVGNAPDTAHVFMPAYMFGLAGGAPFSLLKYDLDTGRSRVISKGTTNTTDWIVDNAGRIVAREEYNNKADLYSIRKLKSDQWTKIFESSSSQPPFITVGIRAGSDNLLVADGSDANTKTLHELTDSGELLDLGLREDRDIEGVITGKNRVVHGVEYSGLLPAYEFFDHRLEELYARVKRRFKFSAVWLVSWSSDFSRLLLRVFDGFSVEYYVVYDTRDDEIVKVIATRDGIPPEAVGEVATMTYKARDGLAIPSVLTWPADESARENLPLIVMPHGGPAAYDSIRFDWLTQFFANRGFLVLQPNFRGSDGFGGEFRRAGHGEWGGKMQDDITDGVNALIEMGAADKQRICIVGASYGGYAALAGGAFTSELYQCVVAIAPLTDLQRLLSEERRDRDRHHWFLDYLEESIGDSKDKLRAISPVNHCSSFTAPVLLIHGKDDSVVPLKQSVEMEKALRKAGKDVSFVRIEGGDHWLSRSETRLATLRALDDFVARHIGTAD